MQPLTTFLSNLFRNGEVEVLPKMHPIDEQDYYSALFQLKKFYDQDILDMPGTAPEFAREGAIWGAQFVYKVAQLCLLRDVDPEDLDKHLTDFEGEYSAENIYSIDLCLRFLPDLHQLANGLAPDDKLVEILITTGNKYPFSAVGMPTNEQADIKPILEHPSLKIAFLDRILKVNDKKTVERFNLNEVVKEMLGTHLPNNWKLS